MIRTREALLALIALPSLAVADLCDTPQFSGGGCSQVRTAHIESGWVPSVFGETTEFRCSPEGTTPIDWHMRIDLQGIPPPTDGSEITLLEYSLDDESTIDGSPVPPGDTSTDGAANSGLESPDVLAYGNSSTGVLSLTLARSATGMRALRFTWREGDPLATVVRLDHFGIGVLGPTVLVDQAVGLWPSVEVSITPNRDWSSFDLRVEDGGQVLIHHVLARATGVNRVHVPRRLRTGLLGGELTDGMRSVFVFFPQSEACTNPY
jgi:hypothetical protein